jgi:hypothetical protein
MTLNYKCNITVNEQVCVIITLLPADGDNRLIIALLGNSPINTFQHTPCNKGGTCVFYAITSGNNGGSYVFCVVTSPSKDTVFSVRFVRSLYNEDLLQLKSVCSSGQLRVVVHQKSGS